MVDIFLYIDFQKYLQAFYTENKALHSFFSYQWLVEKAGFSNRGFIYNIFNKPGTKLSTTHCIKLSEALGHTKREAEYFYYIVAYAQENEETERADLLEKAKKISYNAKIDMLRKDQHSYFSEWHHSVIRSLIAIIAFKGDFAQLSRKLSPPVTPAQAQESVELLERLELIKKGRDGIYRINTEKIIKTGGEFTQMDKDRINLEYMKVAKEVVQNHPPVQNTSSMTLGISEKTYKIICNEMMELKEKIRKLIENDNEADRVFLYQSILIPLTKNATGK